MSALDLPWTDRPAWGRVIDIGTVPVDAEPVALEVVFDYDNRPGIKVNHYCVGAPGGEEPSGTPRSRTRGDSAKGR